MRKFKQLTTAVFAFALTLLVAIMITGTPVNAATVGFTFDSGTGTLTITTNEGFNEFREANGITTTWDETSIALVKSVVIESGVTEITGSACKNFVELTSVTIPESLTVINSDAFKGCAKLTAVTIPNSVTELGTSAFADSGLLEVTIPNSVTEVGTSTFENCKSLKSIKILGQIELIGATFAYGCENLTSVEFPESLKEIYQSAFGKTKLSDITIPAGVTWIGYSAFANISTLKTVTMKSATPPTIQENIFENAPADFKIYVPLTPKGTVDIYKAAPGWVEYKEHIVVEPHDHVAGDWIIDTPATEIAEGTKHTECTLCGEVLQTVALPKIVTPEPPKTIASFKSGIYTYSTNGEKTVKVTGFVKGKSTSKVTIPKSVTYQEKTYQVTEIADKAFYKNTKIKTINIGNNVTKIGKNAFKQCTKLTDAVIGNKVKEIGTSAFYKCTSLKKVTVGTGLKKIGSHVFCHDKKLGELVIKSTKLTTIGKHNLYNCKNLKIKVPSSKVKAYTKLIKGQGQKAKANVKVTK